MDNPYLPPSSSSSRKAGQPRAGWQKLGIGAAVGLTSLYGSIVFASLYEILLATNSGLIVGHQRHFICALVFMAAATVAAMMFRSGQRTAIPLLAFSAMLVIVLVFPGFNMVWNAVAQFLGG